MDIEELRNEVPDYENVVDRAKVLILAITTFGVGPGPVTAAALRALALVAEAVDEPKHSTYTLREAINDVLQKAEAPKVAA